MIKMRRGQRAPSRGWSWAMNVRRRVSAFIAWRLILEGDQGEPGWLLLWHQRSLNSASIQNRLLVPGHQTTWLTSSFHLCDYNTSPVPPFCTIYLLPKPQTSTSTRPPLLPPDRGGRAASRDCLKREKKMSDQTGCDTKPLNLSQTLQLTTTTSHATSKIMSARVCHKEGEKRRCK